MINVMNSDPRSALAHRMHLLLRRELGQGIDEARLLANPLYARDVLLVCDALPAPGLALLASQFRQAEHSSPSDMAGGNSDSWPSSGADSAGPDSTGSQQTLRAVARQVPMSRWLSPSRWLSGRP
jgi:hypothetical protein